MKTISVMDGLSGEYNEETEQYKYEKDSIVTTYKIDNWNQVTIINSDAIKTEYWK